MIYIRKNENSITNRNQTAKYTVEIINCLGERKLIMRRLKELLLSERERLENIVKIEHKYLKDKPEGTLRLSKSKEYTQYLRKFKFCLFPYLLQHCIPCQDKRVMI